MARTDPHDDREVELIPSQHRSSRDGSVEFNTAETGTRHMSETPAPPHDFQDAKNKRIMAGIFGILLGALGIHKFILGYTSQGIIMLLVSVLSLGILSAIPSIIGLIEGILYLTKSDEEFYQTYIAEKRPWF